MALHPHMSLIRSSLIDISRVELSNIKFRWARAGFFGVAATHGMTSNGRWNICGRARTLSTCFLGETVGVCVWAASDGFEMWQKQMGRQPRWNIICWAHNYFRVHPHECLWWDRDISCTSIVSKIRLGTKMLQGTQRDWGGIINSKTSTNEDKVIVTREPQFS